MLLLFLLQLPSPPEYIKILKLSFKSKTPYVYHLTARAHNI